MDLDDFSASVAPAAPFIPRSVRGRDDDYEGDSPTSSMRKWTDLGGDSVGCPATRDALTPGMYQLGAHHDGRILFKRLPINVDDLIRFSDSVSDNVMAQIEQFWKQGEAFARYGYLHRRGFLFYGPAGSGKSSVVQQVVKDIIERGGVVMLCGDPHLLNRGLQTFRTIEPERPVVCVFEDIDAIIAQFGEDSVLSLLDGENQIDRVLNIATTNYPERLDRRIVARPRRFDRVVKIGMPTEAMRREYFSKKLFGEPEEVEQWTRMTNRLSMASLAELVISVKCLGNPLDETVESLKKMNEQKRSSEEFRERGTGFVGGGEGDDD